MSEHPTLTLIDSRPCLVAEGHADWFRAAVQGALEQAPRAEAGTFWSDEEGGSWLRPYRVEGGVLTIPVQGALLHGFPYQFGTYATGYEYVRAAVRRGLDDRAVRGIVLHVNSGGGMVDGCFETAALIREADAIKPVLAVADAHAYSAAYALASAARRVVLPASGGVGSVGVILTHAEMSRMLDAGGITVNVIRSRPGKAEVNRVEALTDEARARLQADIDTLHAAFADLVARHRGLTREAVDATNAQCFMGQAALDAGLADEIGVADDAVTAFQATFSEEEYPMADTQAPTITAADLAAARDEGVASERARVAAILGSAEAEARPAAARAFVEAGMSAEIATRTLAKLPEEATPAAAAGVGAAVFAAAMGKTANPEVGASDEAASAPDPKAASEARVKRALALTGLNRA